MSVIYKDFGRGALDNANATLYSALQPTVTDLWLKNTGVADETVQIAFNRISGGGSQTEITVKLKPGWQGDVLGIILMIGDAIEGFSTNGAVVNWELTGTEITS